MAEEIAMKVIARIHTDFPEKFGIPRQSGLIEELKSTIVFEPEFRDANALRGMEEKVKEIAEQIEELLKSMRELGV